MSTYTAIVERTASKYNDVAMFMNRATITVEDGTFLLGGLDYDVSASDGSHTADAFLVRVSGSRRKIFAFFTTDAFNAMTGPVTLTAALGPDEVTVSGLNLPASIQDAPEIFDLTGLPNADNAWLATL